MDILLLMILIYWVACKIWPEDSDRRGGNDVFIPFEDRKNTTENGPKNNSGDDVDPYFPDGDGDAF